MATHDKNAACMSNCWKIALGVAVFALIILWFMFSFSFFGALLTAIILGAIVWFGLRFFLCGGADEEPTPSISAATPSAAKATTPVSDVSSADVPATPAEVKSENGGDVTPAPAAAAEPVPAAKPAANTTPAAAMTVQPSKALPGQQELASRKGEWKYQAEPKPAAKPAAAKKAPVAAEEPAAAKSAPAVADKATAAKPVKAKAAPAEKPKAAAQAKPEMLSAPRPEGKDDLKLISGVGPKLEQTLNDLGVYHYDQIAKWKKKDVEWVDANLRFKGRIARDDWMSQAKILAKGGETEFSKKKKK